MVWVPWWVWGSVWPQFIKEECHHAQAQKGGGLAEVLVPQVGPSSLESQAMALEKQILEVNSGVNSK